MNLEDFVKIAFDTGDIQPYQLEILKYYESKIPSGVMLAPHNFERRRYDDLFYALKDRGVADVVTVDNTPKRMTGKEFSFVIIDDPIKEP